MSSEVIVGKRYAKALLEAARDKGVIAEVAEDLRSVAAAVVSNQEFRSIWENPSFAASAKKQMVSQAFLGKISDTLLNLIQLLVDKGRETILYSLSEQYEELANESLGQATAKVISAAPLSENEKNDVAATFSKVTGKKIIVENIVNPGLLGGLQVRIGDRLYDGSLAGKLNRLGKTLSQNAL